ncbi:MAG: CpaF family protein [Lachnospiraceae bacterium]|nr:CpaF family protein [Lachnospiraceae bacterium]
MGNDDYKNDIKRQLIDELSDTVGLEDKEILNVIDSKIEDLERNVSPLKLKEKLVLRKSIYDSLKNYDILTEVLEDKNINEIMINSYDEIFIDKNGKYQRWDKSFESKEQLENIIQQIVGKINRIVNVSNPIVDARLSDGSRVHIVLPPIAIKGATVTIRKFPEKITMKKLIEYGSINIEVAKFLEKLVKNGYNIFISGGTGSGKTTFLNALSEFIPKDDRVITIEDSAELNISHVENLVSLETRDKNVEGEGEINMQMLIRAALRMNPDRIVVGEVRGKEALDMLQAMNTGHDGSLSTGHANSCFDMLSRLETMVLMAENLPLLAIRQQIASSIDILIHLAKLKNKKRVVYEISELLSLDEGKYQTNKLYEYNGTDLVKCGTLKNQRKLDI